MKIIINIPTIYSGLAILLDFIGVRKWTAAMAKKRNTQTQRQHYLDESCYLARVCQVRIEKI